MNRKLQLISLLLGVTLVLSAVSTGAVTIEQANSSNIELGTDEFVVNIVGGSQVPQYTFWDPADNNTKYRVMFSSIFEAFDNGTQGTQGVYDLGKDQRVNSGEPVSLQAQDWTISEPTEESNGDVHFDMSSQLSNGADITLANHLYADQENAIKFDVIIDNYPFKSTESILVLSFQVLKIGRTGSPQAAETAQETNTVRFGDGFFETETTAQAGGDIDVGLSTGNSGGSSILYLAYQNFDGQNLVHDPTMGVQASSSSDDSDTNGPNLASDEFVNLWADDISKGAAGMSSLFASIIALIVPITLYKRKE